MQALLSPCVSLTLMLCVATLGYLLSFYNPRAAGSLLLAFGAWAIVILFVWFALDKSGDLRDPIWLMDVFFGLTSIFTLLMWPCVYLCWPPYVKRGCNCGCNRYA